MERSRERRHKYPSLRPIGKTLLALTLFFALQDSAFADLGPLPPEPDRLWFVFLPNSPISKGSDYEHRFAIHIPENLAGTEPPKKLELVFRSDQNLAFVLSVPFRVFERDSKMPRGRGSSSSEISRESMDEIGRLHEGKYIVAITNDGDRISNVAAVNIDPNYEPMQRPVLDLVSLEPAPFSGVAPLGVRATGSNRLGASFTASAVYAGRVIVDGVERRRTHFIWGGPNPSIAKGDEWLTILELDGFRQAEIAANVEHKVSLAVGNYTSQTIVLSPKTPLGNRWDENAKRERQ